MGRWYCTEKMKLVVIGLALFAVGSNRALEAGAKKGLCPGGGNECSDPLEPVTIPYIAPVVITTTEAPYVPPSMCPNSAPTTISYRLDCVCECCDDGACKQVRVRNPKKGCKCDCQMVGPPQGHGTRGCAGPSGLDGRRGEPGLDGAPGRSGVNGWPGTSGESGSRGLDGNNGEDGKCGQLGLKGNDGKHGAPGSRGAPGPCGRGGMPGFQGPPGQPGSKGNPGKNGEQGVPGVVGERGAPGEPGFAGEQGDQGRIGIVGSCGQPGVPGRRGDVGDSVQAVRGDHGVRGPMGPAGVQGEEGTPGIDGSIGASGREGAIGQPGRPGAPGPQGHAGTDSDIDYKALNAIVADLLRNEILSLKSPKCRHLAANDEICPACNKVEPYSPQAYNNKSSQPSSASYNYPRADSHDNVKQPTLNF